MILKAVFHCLVVIAAKKGSQTTAGLCRAPSPRMSISFVFSILNAELLSTSEYTWRAVSENRGSVACD